MNRYEALVAQASDYVEIFRQFRNNGVINADGDFFPAVHYPPITKYPKLSVDDFHKGYNAPSDHVFDIYVHLPFCLKRCLFCHYPSLFGSDLEAQKDRYLSALKEEYRLMAQTLGGKKIKARSILIGGGTPTFLTPQQLETFLIDFTSAIDTSQNTQFNYDVDPMTLIGEEGRQRLALLKKYGVTRLTIGIQSLDPSVLKLMNRHHGPEQAIESIKMARKFGFEINIEFIFGHPGQTMESWISTIDQAMTLDVDEIQLYRLKVEPYGDLTGTVASLIEKRPELFLDNDTEILMKRVAHLMLYQNGFHEVLSRVFTKKKGIYSHYAHNQCCELYDQLGFGLTAFSSLRDRFGLNTQSFDEYYGAIERGALPLNRGYIRTHDEQLRWSAILPIKNRFLKKSLFKERTGEDFDRAFPEIIQMMQQLGLLEDKGPIVQLTALGRFFADEVVLHFYSPEFYPFPRLNA